MARKTSDPEPTPEAIQAEPTRPRPVDAAGRTLDAHGLPLSGPARAARLAELGRPDPRDDPAAWGEQPAADATPPAQD